MVLFFAFFRGVEQGRFSKLDDRDDLRQILLRIADCRAKDQLRRHLAPKRGGGHVRGESAFHAGDNDSTTAGIGKCQDFRATPETVDDLIAFLKANWRLFRDEGLGKVAVDKIEGYKNKEIAERNEMSLRAVERKLGLIRDMLQKEEQA